MLSSQESKTDDRSSEESSVDIAVDLGEWQEPARRSGAIEQLASSLPLLSLSKEEVVMVEQWQAMAEVHVFASSIARSATRVN